jgi:hypothetical protein
MSLKILLSVLFLSLLLVNNVPVSTAQSGIDDSTPVIIIEDNVEDTQCTISTNFGNQVTACPPGTLLLLRKTTYGEVRQKGIKNYAVLTGKALKDAQIRDKLIRQVRQASTINQTCSKFPTPYARTITATRPAPYGSGTFWLQVNYSVYYNCVMGSIRDRVRLTGNIERDPFGNIMFLYRWGETVLTDYYAGIRHFARNISGLNDTYTAWQSTDAWSFLGYGHTAVFCGPNQGSAVCTETIINVVYVE